MLLVLGNPVISLHQSMDSHATHCDGGVIRTYPSRRLDDKARYYSGTL